MRTKNGLKGRPTAAVGAASLVFWACSGGAPSDEGTGGAPGTDVGAGGTTPTGGAPADGEAGTGGALADGGAETGGTGGNSGGEGGAAPGAGGTPMGTCGDPPLEVMGPAVVTTGLDVSPPPPLGGALVDGLYDARTQVRYYNFKPPAKDPNFRQVVRIREGGTILDWFSVQQPGSSTFVSVQSQTVGIVPSGGDLIMSPICPNDGGGQSLPMPYSTRPGEFDLYVDYADGPETRYGVITHVLRP